MTQCMPTITAGHIPEVVYWAWKMKTAAMLWGQPGVGKSQGVKATPEFMLGKINEERVGNNLQPLERINVIDRRLSQYEPVELRGIPRNVPAMGMYAEAIEAYVRLNGNPFGLDGSVESKDRADSFLSSSVGVGLNEAINMTDAERVSINSTLLDRIVKLRGEAADGMYSSIWSRPDLLPRVDRDGDYGIVLLDELTQAPLDVQAAALELILDRRLGDYKLPDGWVVVAAGNQIEDRSGVYEMSAALANRLAHFLVVHDYESWLDWAYHNNIHSKVISFTEYTKGARLNMFEPDRDERIFATARSWEKTSNVLRQHGMPRHMRTLYLGSILGLALAAEFGFFCDIEEQLPDIDNLISDWANGKKFKFPEVGEEFVRDIEINASDLDAEAYDDLLIKERKSRGLFESDHSEDKMIEELLSNRKVSKTIRMQGTSMLYMLVTSIALRASEVTAPVIYDISKELGDVHKEFSVYLIVNACRHDRAAMLSYEGGRPLREWSETHHKSLVYVGKSRGKK